MLRSGACLSSSAPAPADRSVETNGDVQAIIAEQALRRMAALAARAGSHEQVRSEVKRLAGVLLDDVERIAECSVARMQERLPSYAKVPAEKLIAVSLISTRNLLEAVRDPDADPTRAEDHFRVSEETRVSQEIAAHEMLQAWRIGLEVLREEAHLVARRLRISDDALLDFVETTLQLGDVGMRKSASAYRETEIRERERLAAEKDALRRVATLVARGAPQEEVFAAVIEEVVRLLGADLAVMGRYGPDRTLISVARSGGPGDHLPVGSRWQLGGKNLGTMVFETGRPARIDGYADTLSGSLGNAVREASIRSSVATPITVEGRLWGVIAAGSTLQQPLPRETEARLADFTELVAAAVANAESRAELARLAEEQAALRRVATLVARGVPPEQVLAAVIDEVVQLFPVDYAGLARYEPDGMVTTVGARGVAGFVPGMQLILGGRNTATLVFESGRPTRIDGLIDLSGGLGDNARERGVSSAVATPIFVEGRLWGTIGAGSVRDRPVPADTEERLAAFTELVSMAIANAESRAALAASRARIVAAADETRRRIERDLHDGAQQRLVHTVIVQQLALRALHNGDANVGELMGEALQHAERACSELSELAHGILPSVLTREGLRAAVRAIVSRMSLPVSVDVTGERLPAGVEATAYFVVSEALTNVVKHARATDAEVRARVEDRQLVVEVRDNGVGGARGGRGTGLGGLEDRVSALDGRLVVESPRGGGTRVYATLPVADQANLSPTLRSRVLTGVHRPGAGRGAD